MINLISKPWQFVKSLFGLVFPMFGAGFPSLAGDDGRLGRWSARTFVLAIILVILAMINQAPCVWDDQRHYRQQRDDTQLLASHLLPLRLRHALAGLVVVPRPQHGTSIRSFPISPRSIMPGVRRSRN